MQNKHRNYSGETLECRNLLATDLLPRWPAEPLAAHPVDQVVFAPIDGVGNNENHPDWGAAGTQLRRMTEPAYGDGMSMPAGQDRPNPRHVSNMVVAQSAPMPNDRALTDMTWVWGQFIDHDIGLTIESHTHEEMPIDVPMGDKYFDPHFTGEMQIGFMRSDYDPVTGDSIENPRQQINQITAFLDGSVVYGADIERANALRLFDGGKLKTSDDDLLPYNEGGLFPNAGGPSDRLFLAGDIRANENVLLSSMQTIWVREHNRLTDEIAADHPELTEEELYQHARAIVTAKLQAITYNEFLPTLLGEDAIEPYSGYDPNVDPGIANDFSTAAYRFGHSMLSSDLLRLNGDRTPSAKGPLPLRDAFFAPHRVTSEAIDELVLGAVVQKAQEVDSKIIDDVRNFLFGRPGTGGFDLATLNIQRGRDHGLDSYNNVRVQLGLDRAESFADISSDPSVQAELEMAYGSVDLVDPWVGALSEDHLPGASVGELNHKILTDQFQRIRAGDRFWYENIYHGEALAELRATKLSEVILRNTSISNLPMDVFQEHSMMFAEQTVVGGHHSDVNLGDLDGDGFLDAFMSSTVAGGSRVFLNDRGELFDAGGGRLTAGSRTSSLGDVDSDGDLDAIVGANDATMVWLNDGEGKFQDSGQLLANVMPNDIAVGDFDADGDIDLFIVSLGANTVWMNDGIGNYVNSGQSLGNADSLSVSMGDLDDDGDLDAFVTNDSRIHEEPSRVWINDGAGQFSARNVTDIRQYDRHVALGDLDNDGDLDAFLVSGDKETGFDRVLLNDGTGTFEDTLQQFGNYDGVHVALGDFDGDTDLDAFVTNGIGQPSMIWMNDGTGVFYDGGQRLSHRGTGKVAVGDLDNDGDMDAVVSSSGAFDFVWMNLSQIGAGDFNADGKVDRQDVHQLCMMVRGSSSDSLFDLDGSGHVDTSDVDLLITQILGTSFGDANLDGYFNSTDMVRIFQAGQYEDGITANSNWSTGDWNCDGEFDSGDLIVAFQYGGYEARPASPFGPPTLNARIVDSAFAAAIDDEETDKKRAAKGL